MCQLPSKCHVRNWWFARWLIISCNVPAVWAVRTAGCVTSAAGQRGAIPTCQSELEVLHHSRTWWSTSSYGLTLQKSSASMSITSAAGDSLFCLSCVCLHFSHWLWFVLSIGPAGKCVVVAFGFSTATSKSMAITQNEWFVSWSSPFFVHKWFMNWVQNSLMWPLANVICKFLLESNSWSAGDHSNYHSCYYCRCDLCSNVCNLPAYVTNLMTQSIWIPTKYYSWFQNKLLEQCWSSEWLLGLKKGAVAEKRILR